MKPKVRLKRRPKLRLITERRPNPDAVRSVESLLDRVRSGEVISVVYAAGWTGDWTSHGWAVDPRTHKTALLGESQIVCSEYQDSIRMHRGNSVLEDL